ncbi:outer membrane assembly lipoprotein YfiO [Anaeromyxobacter sp. K]|uniref:outer membrane protein assembly factor BamD n=1 Tax=Anaeromyxobacter sp. (strain K) TaxID=447217 RepID=UPI00015F9BC6|nr:outer membrane protein assembly factor BamD [Anaeromyxobacter sp. K]ACG74661.1 outer membrane assembly lipoprotein YfiO [Anaeromyxobacter sp. K]
MRRNLALAAALSAAVALAACGTKHTTFTGGLKLGKTPEENYQAGMDELKADNFTEAVKFFEFVKTKYPFSKFAALSELRLADVKFKQDRYLEAAEAYKQFVQLHPTHEDVDYAEYRSGLAYFKDAPGDFALFPPASEKDQRQAEKAVQVLTDFVQTRTQSKYLADAKKVLAEAQTRLAAREWYVAEYYYKRSRWAGAAGRYETLVDKYPGSAHEPEALWKLASACLKMDEKHRARKALQTLIVKHPGDARRAEAEKLLASIR